MSKIKKENLLKAAEDLNKVLKLEEKIVTTSKATIKELTEALQIVSQDLKKGMKIKRSTINTLLEIECDVPADLTEKKQGVIETIYNTLASSKKPVSKEKILKILMKQFPDRAPDSMARTISIQLPGRMSRERSIKITRTEEGEYLLVS